MQKKLMAVAIAGALAAPLAMADSTVTLYGLIDGGYMSRNGDSGAVQGTKSKTEMASGIAAGNRLGFRGAEDIGGGNKIIFEIEQGFSSDDGSNNFATKGASTTYNGLGTRHSWVGATGDWGTTVAGRVDGARYGFSLKYDPFAGGTVAQGSNIQKHATRADNAIAYISPSWSGFNVLAAYTTSLIGQEAAGNNGDLRLWAIAPQYNNGPISVTVDIEQAHSKGAANDDGDVKIALAGASYDFTVVKLYGYYEDVHTNNRAWDQRAFSFGVSVPVGPAALVRANYSHLDDRTATNADCSKYGVGLKYNLSKRTYLYTDYARINNSDHGICTVAQSGYVGALDNTGAAPGGGVGVNGFDLGIDHSF